MIIAIDGPAGSGKSTIAKELAQKLGFIYIDTGAMFRAVTFYALEHGLGTEEELMPSLSTMQLKSIDGGVELNGRVLKDELRTQDIDAHVSYFSTMGSVREWLKSVQQEEGRTQNVVMDGRDIGTAIFPDAEVKIFLTASPEERARRRYNQRPGDMSYDEILEDIRRRDQIDSTREIAPLCMAEDAYLLDSSNLCIDEVITNIERYIHHVQTRD